MPVNPLIRGWYTRRCVTHLAMMNMHELGQSTIAIADTPFGLSCQGGWDVPGSLCSDPDSGGPSIRYQTDQRIESQHLGRRVYNPLCSGLASCHPRATVAGRRGRVRSPVRCGQIPFAPHAPAWHTEPRIGANLADAPVGAEGGSWHGSHGRGCALRGGSPRGGVGGESRMKRGRRRSSCR